MRTIKNLHLDYDDIRDILKQKQKIIQSVEPVILNDNGAAIIADARFYYYGLINSIDGLDAVLNGVVVASISSNNNTEVFFNELSNVAGVYQFIGYKILVNS